MYYKVFENGILSTWKVQDDVSYEMGILKQDKDIPSKGVKIEKTILTFSNQEHDFADGIYKNCKLIYDEGAIILEEKGQKHFLASVNEYVPVHSYSPDRGENQTIPVKQLTTRDIVAEEMVVALNERGTYVAAIYIIEQKKGDENQKENEELQNVELLEETQEQKV